MVSKMARLFNDKVYTSAIDSESVERLWGNDAIGILYIVGRDEWKKESEGEKK